RFPLRWPAHHLLISIRMTGGHHMRMSTNWGIKVSGMLTAILFAWPKVGCSPSQVGEAPPSAQQISEDEPVAARHKSGETARLELPAGVPAKVASVLHHIDTSHTATHGY